VRALVEFLQMLVAGLFAFFIARAVGVAVESDDEASHRKQKARARLMVPCATCGVYVLDERALRPSGRAAYCSDACAVANPG